MGVTGYGLRVDFKEFVKNVFFLTNKKKYKQPFGWSPDNAGLISDSDEEEDDASVVSYVPGEEVYESEPE